MPCGTLLQTGSYSMTSTRDAERHPYFFYSKTLVNTEKNVGINRFCMYVEGNEDDHSHQPYAEADKRVRSEARQIQAIRGESRRIRPVGRQPCRIHRRGSLPVLDRTCKQGKENTGMRDNQTTRRMPMIVTAMACAAASMLAGLTLAPSPPSDRHPTGDGRTT